MIRMVELRPEDMNTPAREPEPLAAAPPALPELSACAPACCANAPDTDIENKNKTTNVSLMCDFPRITAPVLFCLPLHRWRVRVVHFRSFLLPAGVRTLVT